MIVLSFGLLFVACSHKCTDLEHCEKNEFFGVNLDQTEQVSEFHQQLIAGGVKWKGRTLKEWNDEIGPDYDLSGGKMASAALYDGDAEEACKLFETLDSMLYERYQNREPYQQKEWEERGDGTYRMSFANFFEYRGYRISIVLRLTTPDMDDNSPMKGDVSIGLGGNLSR